MTVLAGPIAIASVLLVAGGFAKARTPGDTARALQAVGVRVGPRLVRLGAALELVVGAAALAFGSPIVMALVAVSYAAFTVFVVRALRAGTPISSCGCFGKIDTPPSRVHVVIDASIALAAAAAAIAGTDVSLPAVLPEQPLLGVPFLLLVGIGVGLVFLAFTSLPRTLAAVREMA